MNIFKNLSVTTMVLASLMLVSPVFALTATVDVDRVLYEYSKSKEAEAQFQQQTQSLQAAVADAQKKIKAAASPVEKKNLEATYDKKIKAQAQKMQAEQIAKLKEIEADIFKAIDKVSGGQYDTILKKSATIYCPNDITDEVIKKLNNK